MQIRCSSRIWFSMKMMETLHLAEIHPHMAVVEMVARMVPEYQRWVLECHHQKLQHMDVTSMVFQSARLCHQRPHTMVMALRHRMATMGPQLMSHWYLGWDSYQGIDKTGQSSQP